MNCLLCEIVEARSLGIRAFMEIFHAVYTGLPDGLESTFALRDSVRLTHQYVLPINAEEQS